MLNRQWKPYTRTNVCQVNDVQRILFTTCSLNTPGGFDWGSIRLRLWSTIQSKIHSKIQSMMQGTMGFAHGTIPNWVSINTLHWILFTGDILHWCATSPTETWLFSWNHSYNCSLPRYPPISFNLSISFLYRFPLSLSSARLSSSSAWLLASLELAHQLVAHELDTFTKCNQSECIQFTDQLAIL